MATTDESRTSPASIIDTGVEGLNAVLCGGLVADRLHIVEGDSGTGKTTLALQFVLEGVRRGENCLFVTLAESEYELRSFAESHGWSLDGVEILEIIPSESSLTPDSRYTMFHPSEVELGETTQTVLAEARRIKPRRLVFDSLSGLRVLAESPIRYRRQILALKQHFAHAGCTILFIDDKTTGDAADVHLQTIANGVIVLEGDLVEYGTLRRRIYVKKMRGCRYREGYHDFVIRKGGLQVFPRLVASEHRKTFPPGVASSGLEAMDQLLGGGLTRGTSALIMGPDGTGKSALATQHVVAAAARGEKSAMFIFDESLATLLERSRGLGLALEPLMESGQVSVRQIDPAELAPNQFSHAVREEVEVGGASLIVIDSLTGYMNAMPSERFLALHLHELLSYLSQLGVTTLMVMTQHGLLDPSNHATVDTSYLADTVLLIRHFEAFGELRQALSVIKKRTGKHERTIREMRFDNGLVIGPPIKDLHGVFTGTPTLVDSTRSRSSGP